MRAAFSSAQSMRILLWAMVGLIFISLCPACRKEKKVDVGNLDSRNMPTMRTVNVNTLISDSGIVQYRIVSPLWLMYGNVDTPYWRFPKGIYLRRFDRFRNVIATVAADSAVYLQNQRIWRLDGRVEITRAPKDLFQTQQLFWNERSHMLYTDSFIHIENETHMLEGYGFRSDDQLQKYTVVRPKGIFPLEATSASATLGAPQSPSAATRSQQVSINTDANP